MVRLLERAFRRVLARQFSLLLLIPVVAVLAAAKPTLADWPEKDLTLIVPGAAGGATDVLARLVAAGIEEKLGRAVLVENRPGANGMIGARQAAMAPADGYTLLMTTNSTWTSRYVTKDPSFDPVEALDPVIMIADIVQVISASPQSGIKTFAQMLEKAKASPGGLRYGTSGQGSVGHLAMSLLEKRAGVKLTHIPYKATPALSVDLAGGSIDLVLSALPTQLELIKSGKVNGVAVTSLKRSRLAPDIPTVAESGLDGFSTSVWLAIAAPKGTPPEVVNKLNQALNDYLSGPALAKFSDLGFEPSGGTPEEQRTRVTKDLETWVPVIETLGSN